MTGEDTIGPLNPPYDLQGKRAVHGRIRAARRTTTAMRAATSTRRRPRSRRRGRRLRSWATTSRSTRARRPTTARWRISRTSGISTETGPRGDRADRSPHVHDSGHEERAASRHRRTGLGGRGHDPGDRLRAAARPPGHSADRVEKQRRGRRDGDADRDDLEQRWAPGRPDADRVPSRRDDRDRTATTPALDPGESAQVSIDWNTSGYRGNRVVHAVADGQATVAESNEANNSRQLAMRILPARPRTS